MKGDKVIVLMSIPGSPPARFEVVADVSGQKLEIDEPPKNGLQFWTITIRGKTGKQAGEHRFASASVLAIVDERKPEL